MTVRIKTHQRRWLICTLSCAIISPADAEVRLTEDDLILLDHYSPIPRYCAPIEEEASLFVYDGREILPVYTPDLAAFDFMEFRIAALFLADTDNDGLVEAFGLGELGELGMPPWGSDIVLNRYRQATADTSDLEANFNAGLVLRIGEAGHNSPSIIIRMHEWACRVSAYAFSIGNIPKENRFYWKNIEETED
ncbi:MAG: hypothetical protein AAFQ36_12720 [Pseudomonadota bacterium]